MNPEHRRDLTREVIEEVRLREGKLVAVKPRAEYAPLFATAYGRKAVLSVVRAHTDLIETVPRVATRT